MKRLFILFSLMIVMLSAKAQGVSDDSRFYVGGNLGLTFGTYTSLYIAPEGYYCILQRLHAGLGISYAYNRDNFSKVSATNYGAKVAARFIIVDQLYAQVEYEGMKYSNSVFQPVIDNFFDETRLLVGGGYRQWIGDYSFTYINVFWNPDATGFTYFSGVNPVIKIGFNFGF